MADIFDEIIQCIRQEQSANGTVYVSRDNLVEFYRNAAPAQTPPPPRPAPVSAPPPARSVFRYTEPSFHEDAPQEERAYSPVDLAEIASMNWDQLKTATANCRACRLCETRHSVVFADGSEHADLMFIGEGPGADEDAQGVPFVGKAGQLLSKMIAAMQFRRSEVYIANIVKCRPPAVSEPPDSACFAESDRPSWQRCAEGADETRRHQPSARTLAGLPRNQGHADFSSRISAALRGGEARCVERPPAGDA